ncbi:MAG TPA: hypothetical protein VNO50_10290 [Pyrinomonadaceae bacterium]|nr:hypothetical protein [Pyrinomonadaceae bacterium]
MKAGFYLDLIRTVFQAVDDEGKLLHRVVAFTSATPGEGVSYVVNVIARELAAQTQKRVLLVDAGVFQTLNLHDPKLITRYCEETELENLLTLSMASSVSAGQTSRLAAIAMAPAVSDWDRVPAYRNECVAALRWNFDYILIDCPSPAVSSEAGTVAPLADGVAIVVKAAQTRRGQIQRLQRLIETAGGTLLGCVLNQRRYPVPGWLYNRL